MSRTIITNAKVANANNTTPSSSIWIKDGMIQQIESASETEYTKDDHVIDANSQLLIPGMIDVHIHGASGYDMMDGTEKSIMEVSRTCAATGCTSFLATSVTSSLEDLMQFIRNVKQVKGREPGAKIAGIHLEGPYLNVKRKGMQSEIHMRNPDIAEMNAILNEADGLVKMVTVAPELPGGMEMVEFLHQQNIIVALAHSDATYLEAKEAFSKGASHVTHCFNAMRPVHHRDPGMVVAAFEASHVSLQAIVDNIHLHPSIVRLMHQIKGPNGVALITDALQAMYMGDGTYTFGGQEVTVKDAKAQLSDGTLASSTVTMNEALSKTVANGIPLVDAVRMATATPAAILGLENTGELAVGKQADFVLLDSQYNVLWTMLDGEMNVN